MADAIIGEPPARRHGNSGRKQTQVQITKRIAAVSAAKSAWTPEKRKQVRQNLRAAQIASILSSENKHRRSVAHQRTSSLETVIYGLFDPVSRQLRYVGKTTAALKKRWSIHNNLAKRKTQRHIYNWWRGLIGLGLDPEIFEIERVPPGCDWVEAEQFWISYYRFIGCDLVNSCDGGQGTSGIKFSAQHLERLSLAHKGRKLTQEQRDKIGASGRLAWSEGRRSNGRKPDTLAKSLATREVRRAAGLYKKRRPATEETKAKISAGKRGKLLTEEHKAKLSAIRKGKQIGRVMSEESRAKMSAAHTGVSLSAAHREAITIGGRRMRAARKTT